MSKDLKLSDLKLSDLKDCRNQLDDIDKKLKELLARRMKISEAIGKIKLENKLPINNRKRELEILSEMEGEFTDYIKNIYETIFIESKRLQRYDYFLVGKTLNYSFSPFIYQVFGLSDYNIYETDNFKKVESLEFSGINITNPYKAIAFNSCSETTEIAKRLNSVNLIIKKDNYYFGDNTDYYGFKKLLEKFKVEINHKKVIIIGNGDSSRTVKAVVEDLNARSIIKLCRSPREVDESNITEYQKYLDFELIINTTPYGTYPNLEVEPLFELKKFLNLKCVIDLVYNPIVTPLISEANKYHITAINGLYMLVSQAAKNANYFLNNNCYQNRIEEVYEKLLKYQLNIVLIGMPYSGKSFVGEKLAKLLNKKYVDIDKKLTQKQFDLKTILQNSTLEDYRKKEAIETTIYAKEWNQVISTGGGIVLNQQVMFYLKRNGIIIFLDEALESLCLRLDDTTPLIKNETDLRRIYSERINLYNQSADIKINRNSNTTSEIEFLNYVMEKINEYISNQWS